MSSGIVETQGSSGSSSSSSTATTGSQSKLVQKLLSASSSLPAFVNDLLTTQAVVVAGTEAAGFLIEKSDAADPTKFSLRPIAHVRPDQSTAETRAAALQAFADLIKPCIEQNKDGAIEIGGANDTVEPQFCLITLLRNEGEVVAVSAVITRCRDVARAQQRLMPMQLVAGYFDLFTLRRTSDQSKIVAQSHQHVLQLVTAVSTAEGFQAAANNFCNELALRTGAVRVAMGWIKGLNIKVKALSHTEQFDKKQELIVQLENAMDECIDQEESVQFDPEGQQSSQNVTRAAQQLSRAQGGNVIISLPLRRQAEIVGVVTLEFSPQQRIGPQAATGLAVAVDLLAPQLYDRFQNDRYLVTKTGISIRETAKLAMGPKHMLPKLVIFLSLVAVLVICNWIPGLDLRPMYHVSAPFQFAATEKRSISPPFEGYIKEVLVTPGGDTGKVIKGQVLLTMDTTDLVLKKNDADASANTHLRAAEAYRADPEKIADYKIEMARRDESLRQSEFYAEQIKRATIIAPVDGVILKGELKEKIGTQVKPSDVLFEIGEPNKLRVELAVDERDVQLLSDKPGEDGKRQKGTLATSSLPTDKYGFTIDRIVPLGNQAQAGSNVFKVFATPDESAPGWLPGMQGEARIDVAKKPIVWIWTHRLIDFVRMKIWM